MRPRPVVGKAAVPDAVRRLMDKFDYPDRESSTQVLPILPTLGAGSTGAFIHLSRSATQSIASGGELIEWDIIGLQGFAGFAGTVPATTVTIQQAGYYNLGIQLGWDSFTEGGTITVLKNGATVWPPAADPGLWSVTDGQFFEGTAHSIQCVTGDVLSVNINPDDASAQTLDSATLAVYLVDRVDIESDWFLEFAVDDQFGITWDGFQWWTTDPQQSPGATEVLFERNPNGSVLNSYVGYDIGAVPTNTGLVFAESFLWGTGDDDDEAITKIDPSDGSVVSRISATGAGARGYLSVGYNGTNLFAAESGVNERFEEYTTAGAHVQNINQPAGHVIIGLTWDGSKWWATTQAGQVIRMDSSLAFEFQITSPPTSSSYDAWVGGSTLGDCHYRDGFLYVMTTTGLYRKAV